MTVESPVSAGPVSPPSFTAASAAVSEEDAAVLLSEEEEAVESDDFSSADDADDTDVPDVLLAEETDSALSWEMDFTLSEETETTNESAVREELSASELAAAVTASSESADEDDP